MESLDTFQKSRKRRCGQYDILEGISGFMIRPEELKKNLKNAGEADSYDPVGIISTGF